MESKKSNLLDNLRIKFPILKKPGKKPGKKAGKQPKKLAYRRSISVPDLRIVPSQSSPSSMSSACTAIIFDSSPGQSDTDSVLSGSFTGQRTSFSNQMRSPLAKCTPYEVIDGCGVTNAGPESHICSTGETLNVQVYKSAKMAEDVFYFPVPTPSSTQVISVDQENGSTEIHYAPENTSADRTSEISPGVAAALARASSFGDQAKLLMVPLEKETAQRHKKTVAMDRWSLPVDAVGTPVESAYGTFRGLACGTPTEERVKIPSGTDSEEIEQEPLSPFISEILLKELSQQEGAQREEAQDETMEVSSEQSDVFDEIIKDPSDNSEVVPSGSEVPTPAPFQRYLVTINLKEGRNLVIKNKRSGTSDPYVKFKLEGKQFYKSKVAYKTLNPLWNETFSHPLREREHIVEARVYNKNRTSDEFMGTCETSLNNLELYKTYRMEMILSDPKSKEEDIGVLIVEICLMFRDATIKKSPRWKPRKNKGGQQHQAQAPAVAQSRDEQRNQLWTGVFSITLVEGQDLPQYGHGDLYVRFRLGDQKYKSKNLCIQANPQWREQFDFNQFEDNQELLQVEAFSKRGRKCEESWGMFEVDLSGLVLSERHLYTHVLDPGKGRLVFLVTLTPCWGVSIADIAKAPLDQSEEKDTIVDRFSWKNSLRSMREVGFLQVKVIKATDLSAADLNGKSDPFCVVELGNSKLQTHTIYKTLNPEWNTVLTFPIKDIHDVLELTVFDENTDKSPNFLGKAAIPLLTVQNGQQLCWLLKKEKLERLSKGTITLELDVIYNKVKAGVKSFQPKETKLMEETLKFNKKVLAQNIYRLRKISTAVLYTLQYIKSCFQWESTQRSLIAFLVFLLMVWHWEPFMLPLFLFVLISWNYFQLASGRASSNQDLVNMSMADDEEEDEKQPGKKGLREKIHMVQEIVLIVQNILDEIASMGERIKNTFNWSVPFLSCLACLVLFGATTLLYYIPLRYIVLIWGVNKFTKKLRNPHAIDNNEILDFLKRVPTDLQKVQYSEPRGPGVPGPARRKR